MSLLPSHDELFAFAERKREQYEHLLKEFVAVPTVSSQPKRQRDIERGVELATETIRSFGARAKVHRSKGAVISMEKVLKCPVMFLGLSSRAWLSRS